MILLHINLVQLLFMDIKCVQTRTLTLRKSASSYWPGCPKTFCCLCFVQPSPGDTSIVICERLGFDLGGDTGLRMDGWMDRDICIYIHNLDKSWYQSRDKLLFWKSYTHPTTVLESPQNTFTSWGVWPHEASLQRYVESCSTQESQTEFAHHLSVWFFDLFVENDLHTKFSFRTNKAWFH